MKRIERLARIAGLLFLKNPFIYIYVILNVAVFLKQLSVNLFTL